VESSPDLFNSMGSRLGVTRGGVESSKDPGRPRALRSGVWGVEDSRDRQQKAASGVGFVEDSGDRNNHHNIEFFGGVESTTDAGGQGRASTPQGSDDEY